jgi:hypothetical protein
MNYKRLKEELHKIMVAYEMPHGTDFDDLWQFIESALKKHDKEIRKELEK